MIIDATKIDYFQNPPRSSYDALISVFKNYGHQKNKLKADKNNAAIKTKTNKKRK